MIIELKDKSTALVRLLHLNDAERLFHYFSGLSAETKSRFAPHPFTEETAIGICNNLAGDTRYYIAVDETGLVIAYMLIKQKMIEEDRSRLLARSIYFNQEITCTFAPSVADRWQNTGLGSAMYDLIVKDILENTPYRVIVLWGGVQATNERAVHFYEKKGFKHLDEFFANEKNNYDMVNQFDASE